MKKILKTLTFCLAFLAVCVVFAGCTGGSDNQDLIDRIDAIDQKIEESENRIDELENPEVPAEVRYAAYQSNEGINEDFETVACFITMTETTLTLDVRYYNASAEGEEIVVFDLTEIDVDWTTEYGVKFYSLVFNLDKSNIENGQIAVWSALVTAKVIVSSDTLLFYGLFEEGYPYAHELELFEAHRI